MFERSAGENGPKRGDSGRQISHGTRLLLPYCTRAKSGSKSARLKPQNNFFRTTTVAGAREACVAAAATRGFPARHVWRCALRHAAAAGEAEVVVQSIMAFYDDRYVVSSAEVRVVAPGAH